jgi:hypothetical protein
MATTSEKLGRAFGWMSAPAFAAIAALRHARVFHPVGDLLEGRLEASPVDEADRPIAEALSGRLLVRFSGALWKRRTSPLPDVLGCALRVRGDGRPDQDLLFATIRRPWTMGFSPFTTRIDDYLANHYFAVSPFTAGDRGGRFYLRLRPETQPREGGTRRDRLAGALSEGPIEIALETSERPFGPWRKLATVRLERFAETVDPALRFDPFANGRGIEPRGLVHALRRGAYAASQAARLAFA